MKYLFPIFILSSILLFNSCQKTRELFFATKMEGKVIDLQSGKGIPNANLNVYRMSGYYNTFIKIAELTLHVIQQQKEIAALQLSIIELKK